MNTSKDTNIVNSSQYAPIYVIQNPGAAQANYIITVANVEQKPVSNNLKSFYENSGNIEGVVVNTTNTPKPRILKKTETSVVGNSLKLASFLLPKNDNVTSKPYILNNFVFKPEINGVQTETVNSIPKLDIDRKIVKLKDVAIRPRNHIERLPPKIKPKEIIPITTQAKVTSVQLLKLGETYHSLNKLDNVQMKKDNQGLKMFNEPEKFAPEAPRDTVTKTKFIYKVVTPKELTVVGKKNIFLKERRDEKKVDLKKENVKKQIFMDEFENEPEPPTVIKVTRSGRTVKLPKLIVPQDRPHKRKKKNHIVTCFQCSAEFSSLYRLQKHYENHPTHIPAKIHSNLFHCLLAIVKGGSESDRTNIFVQQLEQLIVKLKSLWPCLLNKMDGSEGKACTINEDVGRIFGMNSGKYNIDINALNCVKDKDGYCVHNPRLKIVNTEMNQPLQTHVSVPSEEVTTFVPNNEDCARISSAENWPTVHKRVWKLKKLISEKFNPKKMKLDNVDDSLITIQMEDIEPGQIKVEDSNNIDMRLTYECDDILSKLGIDNAKEVEENAEVSEDIGVSNIENIEMTENNIEDQSKSKGHLKFHSAHFDIRSSPIKPSSTVFHKFQIHPEKLPKYDVQMIGTTDIIDSGQKKDFVQPNGESLDEIFTNNIEASCKQNHVMDQDWILAANDKSEDGYTKSNNLIEPALLHVKDSEKTLNINGHYQSNEPSSDSRLITNQEESVLQFFDALGNTCLSYPEMEIRANANDFNLDLFSFPSS